MAALNAWPVVSGATTGSYTMTANVPYYITTTGTSAVWTEVAPPRKPTALEWLDAEVERTCALAR
jgi:hypothetical protein